MSSPKCSVCKLPNVTDLDADLNRGRFKATTARKFGVSRNALNRHVDNLHVKPTPGVSVAAGKVSPVISSGDPLADLRAQLADLDSLLAAATSPSLQMQLFAERRRTNVEIARLMPPPPPVPNENVGLPAFLSDVTTLLRKHGGDAAVLELSALWTARKNDTRPPAPFVTEQRETA